MTPVEPEPSESTIARHLRLSHGYEMAYTIGEHPAVLLGQHKRIHQTLTNMKRPHSHE